MKLIVTIISELYFMLTICVIYLSSLQKFIYVQFTEVCICSVYRSLYMFSLQKFVYVQVTEVCICSVYRSLWVKNSNFEMKNSKNRFIFFTANKASDC